MNPIDILGVHPTGAFAAPPDARDYKLHSPEIGKAVQPFDWDKGYDAEVDVGLVLPTKDQMQAGSCGGESVSYNGQIITKAYLNEGSEKSAKAPYSQVFVPGGGSYNRALGDIYVKQGIYKESLVPSYPADGSTVTEAFMDRPQDISAAARADAAKTAALFAYAFPLLDIESIAQATRDCKGLQLGLYGSNNGTWLTSAPDVKQVGSFWSHFMYAGKANIHAGKKGIWAKQSWGKAVAPDTNAWQFLSADHFAAGRIWGAMSFLYAPKPANPKHMFLVDIKYGQTSAEVSALQTLLGHLGYMNVAATGYYCDITAAAVLKFRTAYGVSSATDPLGHSVGPLTRTELNKHN